jgi:hypothetical protein
MVELSDRQLVDYFRRSYTAVDGLWFVKLEERDGFDTALEVDVGVWKVMPKVQARKLKELTGLTEGLEALRECFTTKLAIEDFTFEAHPVADGQGFEVRISRCPWYELLIKSKREHVAAAIGQRICQTEYTVWAAEFGRDITFSLGERLCNGCGVCEVRFRRG